MKAAVLEGIDKLVVKDIEAPAPDAGEMVIKVEACAVCGSDLRIYHHGNRRVEYPQIVGHEVSGVVQEVGEGVTVYKPGDKVCLGADVPCGKCKWCANGMGTNCPINYAIGYQFDGGFAEYMLVNKTAMDFGPVSRIPEGVSLEEAALAEPLACAINGLELVNMSPGKTVAIFGLGPIGCMMVPLLRHMGASKVIGIQRSRARLETAKEFGADVYVCSDEENPVNAVMEATDGEGADVIITTCGSVEAHEQAVEMVAHRGWVNLFGGLGKDARKMAIYSNDIHYKECRITGSHGSLPRHHRTALDLISAGYVDVSKVITHRYNLDDIHEAFETVESRKGLKILVKP